MNTAKDAEEMKNELAAQDAPRPDIVQALAEECLGWPYVFGAAGEMCTVRNRKTYAGYNPEYQSKIYGACPVLSGKKSECAGCEWDGVRIFDCRGFTRWLLSQAGLSLAGGGATSQWETKSNWAAQGTIDTIPKGLVCCVFKRKEGKMSHTGMHVGGGKIIHCSTIVKRDTLPGTPAWTHWGVPAGLYTDEELRKAGLDVDESKNTPTLRRGCEGNEVKALQETLNYRTGAGLTVDGKFGAKTEQAVKDFQNENGLAVDGIVGPKTRAALGMDGETDKDPDADDPDMDVEDGSEDTVTVSRDEMAAQRRKLDEIRAWIDAQMEG